MDRADLDLLGYSQQWVEYGFLTREFLTAQVARFHTGTDQNTEHFRYGAFRELQRRAAFSDQEFQRYVELATADPNPGMGTAALWDLVHHPGLTETQWEVLLAHPRLQEQPRLVKKERLLRELRRPHATTETFQQCVEEGDSDVHRALLDRSDLPHSIIEALFERAGNKAVRNLARIRLQHCHYDTS